MNDDLKNQVINILENNLYMTVAVADKSGNPWIANLYYSYDKKYNFYWYSPKDSVHSKMIKENNSLAICIFNSTLTGNDVDAVYIKARAYELDSKKEITEGLVCYVPKMLKTNFINQVLSKRFLKQYGDFQEVSKLRMHKAIPEKFYKLAPSEMFNDKFIDSRLEVQMLEINQV